MERVLITGGAGYIGSVLSEYLLNRYHVTVYDNLMYKQTSPIDLLRRFYFYKFVHGDVREYDKLKQHIKNADFIIPLAAIVGAPACEKDKTSAAQINFKHVNFISKNISNDQMIIYPNTNSGYGVGEKEKYCTERTPLNPISFYGFTKCEAEDAVLDEEGVSLRLATVFGASPRMRLDLLVNDFVYRAVKDRVIVLFEKDFMRNYIHIGDVVRAFGHIMMDFENHRGEIYNVGLSDTNISKLELAERIKKYIPDLTILEAEFAQDPDKRDYIVSNAKIESTGFKPIYSLDYGIRELKDVYEVIKNINTEFTNL